MKNVLLRKIYHQRPLDKDVLTEATLRYAERIRPFIADTSLIVNRALDDGQTVLCEGAQATLLDLDHGTYPFVTVVEPDRRRRVRRPGHRADPDRPRCSASPRPT